MSLNKNTYKSFSGNWYEEHVEEGVRELVFLLRNNGINTEDSCEHEKYIQCQFMPDGEIKTLLDLLYSFLHEKELSINFEINLKIKVIDGHQYPSLTINLKN